MKNIFKRSNNTRNVILIFILIGTIVLNFLHLYGGNQYPSVHAICPNGGLENLWAFIGGRSNISKIFSGTMTLFFLTIIFTLIFGRSFCGNICPFGALFEFIGKIKKKKLKIPPQIDKYLRNLKYLVLILVTYMAWKTATLWISPFDPYAAFAHLGTGNEILTEMPIGFFILILLIIASIFINRFFCRYLCPAGALYALISKISFLKIKRNSCINCGTCTKSCPMGIDVKNQKEIKGGECIACDQCISNCPNSKKYIGFVLFGKKMKSINFIIITVLIFFVSLIILNFSGHLRLSIPSIQKIEETKNYIKFADLKGSMSIDLGAQYTGKNLSDFYKLMKIPESVSKETLLKEVSGIIPGYDFHVAKSSVVIQ